MKRPSSITLLIVLITTSIALSGCTLIKAPKNVLPGIWTIYKVVPSDTSSAYQSTCINLAEDSNFIAKRIPKNIFLPNSLPTAEALVDGIGTWNSEDNRDPTAYTVVHLSFNRINGTDLRFDSELYLTRIGEATLSTWIEGDTVLYFRKEANKNTCQ